MKRRIIRGCVVELACICGMMAAAEGSLAQEPFVPGSFNEAIVKAQSDKKLLFIDFYTTWCGPCKVLEQTTFKDGKVIAWLKQHTVAIRIDAEKEADLSNRYRVEGYPTLLFLRADGTEMGRAVGALNTDEFLEEAAAILSGKDPLTRAKEKLAAGGENDPMARQTYAGKLAEMGKDEEALKEYLWCFDEGLKHSPPYAGVRVSFLLGEISDLGRRYPKALDELRKRRDAARDRLAKPGSSGGLMDVMDFASINRELEEGARTLELYDRLRKEQPGSPSLDMLKRYVFDELLDARRYAEIARDFPILESVEDEISQHRMSLSFMREERRKEMESVLREMVARQVARYYEVLIGTSNEAGAAKVAARLIELEPGAISYHALAEAALRTGTPGDVNLVQARKAVELSQGENAEMADTLAQILSVKGRKDEACSVLDEALKKAQEEHDKAQLMMRRNQIGCGAGLPFRQAAHPTGSLSDRLHEHVQSVLGV